MALRKKFFVAAAMFLLGTGLAVAAQAQYQYPPSAYGTAGAAVPPPSSNYDPYTSGFGPCPQRTPNDSLSCREQMPPSYGQPDYRPH